ncbi:MAG: lysine 2,3-aminomutase, partial [Pseudonocardiales bacterium]
PRIVCDVPYVGKRWVHQLEDYDEVHGVSYWTKNYRTGIEEIDPEALTRRYEYFDPIHTLPDEGQAWWHEQTGDSLARADLLAASSHRAAQSLVGG